MKVNRLTKGKEKIVPLSELKAGDVFRFFEYGTKRLLPAPMLRLSRYCGYAELGGAFDSVEVLDRKRICNNNEKVKVLGKLIGITV